MKIKASVIIPVYNIEKYLVNNLESMISQLGEDLEFIYINDGSTDGSLSVLNEYKEKDDRIKVISQENKGLSVARNRGLQSALGEVVFFVDGDDYVAEGMVSKLAEFIQQNDLDMLLIGEKEVFNKSRASEDDRIIKNIMCGSVTTGRQLLLTGKAVFTGCLYIYRGSFIKNNQLYFKEGVLHEDMDYIPRALYFANRVMITNCVFYYHVKRPGSITATANIQRCRDLIQIANSFDLFCREEHLEGAIEQYFQDYIRSLFLQGVHLSIISNYRINDIFTKKTERKKMIDKLFEGDRKQKIVAMILSLKADTLYKRIYKLYKMIKGCGGKK